METRLFLGQKVKVTSLQKHCRRESLHSCECRLLLVNVAIQLLNLGEDKDMNICYSSVR